MIPRGQRYVRVGELVCRNTEGPRGLVLKVVNDQHGIPVYVEVLSEARVQEWYIDDLPLTAHEMIVRGMMKAPSIDP